MPIHTASPLVNCATNETRIENSLTFFYTPYYKAIGRDLLSFFREATYKNEKKASTKLHRRVNVEISIFKNIMFSYMHLYSRQENICTWSYFQYSKICSKRDSITLENGKRDRNMMQEQWIQAVNLISFLYFLFC